MPKVFPNYTKCSQFMLFISTMDICTWNCFTLLNSHFLLLWNWFCNLSLNLALVSHFLDVVFKCFLVCLIAFFSWTDLAMSTTKILILMLVYQYSVFMETMTILLEWYEYSRHMSLFMIILQWILQPSQHFFFYLVWVLVLVNKV